MKELVLAMLLLPVFCGVSYAITFAQLALGGGYECTLILTNKSVSRWTGTVRLYQGHAQKWIGPWKANSQDYSGTDGLPITLDPKASRKFVLTGDSTTRSGYLEILGNGTSAQDIAIAYFYNYYAADGRLLDTTGSPPSRPATRFTFAVERSASVDTGLAWAPDTDRSSFPISMTLYDQQGMVVQRKAVPFNGHTAMFFTQVFDVPAVFLGHLLIESASTLCLTVLRLETTKDGFQLTSTPPEEWVLSPSEFEGGKLSTAGRIPVVQLNGDFRKMGRQYGALLKSQISSFYQKGIVENFPSGRGLTREQILEYAKANYEKYPQRLKEVFNGMAETSGLGTDMLMLLDQYPLLTELARGGGCSTLAAWGNYTGGGPLVFAKNEDWFANFQMFNDSVVVVVYNPDDGSRSVASICNAGQVSTMNEMNNSGLVLSQHAAPMWGDGNPSGDPPFIKLLSLLLDSSSFETFDTALRSYRPLFNLTVNAADANRGWSYEIGISDTKRRVDRQEGLFAAANHFVDPSWAIPPSLTSGGDWLESVERYNNLITLAENNKGALNAAILRQILDTPKGKGGATFVSDPVFLTIFQFVAVPSESLLWVKVPGYQDWVEVKLSTLFRK